MATLSVLKFDYAIGADQALETLQRLQQQHLIQILDAAVVTWPMFTRGPKTKQATNLAGAGALGGAFWGTLFGLIFFVPLLGLVVGAATGALGGAFADIGIDDRFIEQTRNKVIPGTSALFLLSAGEVAERVIPELQSLKPELIMTNLPADKEANLRELFAENQPQTGVQPQGQPQQ